LRWYEWHRKRPTAWIRGLVALYAGLAVSFSLLAIDDCIRPSTPIRAWLPAFVNAFQVVMGMPLLVIAATTALVEERARGSLDVLLATPVSTRHIVLVKWWSAFRHVGRLLVLPVLVAAVEAGWSDNWLSVVLLAVQLVVWAAAWTSIGLALSTWVSSLARAVAAVVVLYALAALGWPMLVLTVFGEIWTGARLALVSPFYGSFYLTRTVENTYMFDQLIGWVLAWLLGSAIVALGLLLATLATFDRCLGRVRERGARPEVRAAGRQ
jgi:ABC-type transport system involved in multi-copper enzyme maturation permease subunit